MLTKKKLTKEVCKRILSTKEFPEDILWIAECESKVVAIKVPSSSSSSCPNDKITGLNMVHWHHIGILFIYIYLIQNKNLTKPHITKISL